MTQTLRVNKSKFGCEIWYHPNSSTGKTTDNGARWCYDVSVRKLENLTKELSKYYGSKALDEDVWEDISENRIIQELILAIGNGARYEVSSESGEQYFCRNLKEVYDAYDNFTC